MVYKIVLSEMWKHKEGKQLRMCKCVSERVVEEKCYYLNMVLKNDLTGDFPGGPVAKTPHYQCRGPGFHPWSGN